ncbi:efflux RND transporter permease subunit [Bosea sp. PAMC 26642]|uniref:efflux RND transporter permease subunit n=1 Tax=Bosea sp. (strain PAMC 26642) TaxID=1792307 RepID=UPI0007705380|nr:efflux RND transporter permease subunit [Bosea sp. PAMC 26642]AMJ59474.1 acriflavine resistance protein B [Bosea sp. PAMC 26642]
MSISGFCIRHPVATILMSLSLVLAGLFAYRFLPVAALPRAEFPVVNVSAQLPGASPDTMATSVATPLVKQFATIAGIDSIATTNSQGSTSIAIQFVLSRNIDAAAADVQAAIARAQKQLPLEMTTPPSYRKVNPADAPIVLLALKSDVVPLSQLDAFAQQVISPALSTVDGVAQVLIFGSQKYAVRIQIDPVALAARGIGVDELQAAITATNANTPVGTLQNTSQQLTIQARTQLANAAQFANVIITTRNGRPVRLGDVAKVIDSVENALTSSAYDGMPAVVLAVQRQPDANTVEVVDRVKAMLPAFSEQMPAAASLALLNDRSSSIRMAVDDVQFTLLLTIVLVVMVIFVFLRRLAATFIPAVAVPISIVATLAAMYAFGFSIDNISLLGLTLSVGLVVDDAIVMLENIVRHMEEDGLSAYDAALKGSSEIGFTIISISLSLVAVFIPVLLMGGVIGRIFNEFAVVVTVAILASAFVSLTLTPMLCSRLLGGYSKEHKENAFGRILERGFDGLLHGYDRALTLSLRFKPVMLLAFFATLGLSVWLLQSAPKGFFPQEDIGQLQVSTEARQDISFPAMKELQGQVAEVFRNSPFVAHVASTVGGSAGAAGALNAGRLFVELKPQKERPPLQAVLVGLRRDLAGIPGITAYMTPVQNLNIGARSSKSQYQLVVQGLDQALMNDWSVRLADAMTRDRATFADVTTDLQNSAAEATLVVDRDKANQLKIGSDVLRSTLYSGFGVRQVSTIYTTGDSYQVVVEFDPKGGWSADRLDQIRIRAGNGTLIPLSSFAHVERTAGQLTVNQLGQLPAVTISYNLPAGVALGASVTRIEALKAEINLPKSLSTTLAGTAKTFQDSLANQGLLIMGAILTIYIVLGILYESFIHPLTILTGLPSAAIGALGALRLFDLDLSVIAIIGLLMLIGIVKKNAIMMIDVALVLKREGKEPEAAIHQACVMRFRPILMTTLAALMGTLPIALGAGASAELRQPLGIAVVGGLMISQVLTLFITPVLFLYMDRLERLFTRKQVTSGAAVEPHPAPAE